MPTTNVGLFVFFPVVVVAVIASIMLIFGLLSRLSMFSFYVSAGAFLVVLYGSDYYGVGQAKYVLSPIQHQQTLSETFATKEGRIGFAKFLLALFECQVLLALLVRLIRVLRNVP